MGNRRRKLGLESAYRPLFTNKQLIALHGRGLNDREIAEELSVNRYTVKSRRRRLGLKTHGRRLRFTDQQLTDLYEKGLNDWEIAEELGVTRSAVNYRRKKLGLESAYRPLFTNKQLIALHGRGLNDREIAEELSVNRHTVKSRRGRLGLKANSPTRKEALLVRAQNVKNFTKSLCSFSLETHVWLVLWESGGAQRFTDLRRCIECSSTSLSNALQELLIVGLIRMVGPRYQAFQPVWLRALHTLSDTPDVDGQPTIKKAHVKGE